MIQLPSRKSKLDLARIDPVIRSGVESGKTYAYPKRRKTPWFTYGDIRRKFLTVAIYRMKVCV